MHVYDNISPNVKTHILRSVTFPLENHADCEMMWKNVAEPERPQMPV